MAKKKAAQGSGSIRQRPDGRWEARVTIGTNPGTGKPIRRSLYGATQREVRKAMTAVLRDLDRGTYQVPNKISVAEWFTEWLTTFCTNKVNPLTYQSYEGIIKNHIIPVIGAVELQAVKGTHIQRLYKSMTKAGLSGKPVKNVSAVLHKAFGVALKQGLIASNPCEGAELPKTEKHEITPLADDEIPLFLTAIDSFPMRNAYALCFVCWLSGR